MDIKYFDHAATTPLKEDVLEAMLPYFKNEYGNPSSIYSIGQKAKMAIEDAREKVSEAINSDPLEIYFTGSGSESDNTAIKGIAYANREKGNHIITSKIEHPAVLETCETLEKQGFEITYLNVDSNGIIDLNELEKSITDKTILISIMYANNEIGTIEPIKEISMIAKKHNIYFHTDAVQALGNVKIDVKELGIDLLSISAHKIYGPKGVGALYVKRGVKFDKILNGGHQERNKRAGTENVAGIVGFGKAIQIANENLDKNIEKLTKLRNHYINKIEEVIPNAILNGDKINRLPGNANFSFDGVKGESLLLSLDLKGICASSGSACTSGSLDASHVLLAIGLDNELAKSSLRITFGDDNTLEDVNYLINAIYDSIKNIMSNK